MEDRVVDYLDLMDRVHARVAGHPNALRVSLMLKPARLDLRPGEILITRPTPEGAVLRPYRLIQPATAPAAWPALSSAQAAVALASRLWLTVLSTGGPTPSSAAHTHLPRFVNPEELRSLPLPIGGDLQDGQTVALADHGIEMERPETREGLSASYRGKPRTRVYEVVNIRSDGPWSMIALFLGQLAGYEVDASIYESVARDATLGEHFDDWHGIAIQYDGSKRWALRPDPASEPTYVDMNPGDALVVPRGLLHDLTTPADPGYSRHVSLAIETSRPPLTSRGSNA